MVINIISIVVVLAEPLFSWSVYSLIIAKARSGRIFLENGVTPKSCLYCYFGQTGE